MSSICSGWVVGLKLHALDYHDKWTDQFYSFFLADVMHIAFAVILLATSILTGVQALCLPSYSSQ